MLQVNQNHNEITLHPPVTYNLKKKKTKNKKTTLVKIWRHWKSHILLVETKWFRYFEKQFDSFSKILNIGLPYDLANSTIFTYENFKKQSTQKNFYLNVHSIVHNSQKVETNQFSINWWMKKKWHASMTEYLATEGNELVVCGTM